MTPGLQTNSTSAVSPEVDVRQTKKKSRSQVPLLELASAELEKLQQHQQASSFPTSCRAILTNMEGNATCIDCGRNNPEWAAVSYGALVCLYCSGNHRSFGVNVSTVRSITMDHWSAGEILKMLEGGNRQLQKFFQRHSLYLDDSAAPQQQFQSPHLTKDNVTTMRYKTKAALFYRQQLEHHVQDLKERGPYKGRRRQQTRQLGSQTSNLETYI
jgi:hypothetical protein